MDERAQRIRQAIEDSGLTFVELEKKTGIPKSTLQRYASGDTKKIPVNCIEEIAAATGVSAPWLMGWSQEPSPAGGAGDTVQLVAAPQAYVPVPVLGRCAAGIECFADTNIEEYIPVDARLIHDGYDYCFLRVKGDSMEPEIREGDLVLVRVQDSVNSGAIAVVLIDDENGVVKRFEYDFVHAVLISENPSYEPRVFRKEEMNRLRVFGLVVEVRRRFL